MPGLAKIIIDSRIYLLIEVEGSLQLQKLII